MKLGPWWPISAARSSSSGEADARATRNADGTRGSEHDRSGLFGNCLPLRPRFQPDAAGTAESNRPVGRSAWSLFPSKAERAAAAAPTSRAVPITPEVFTQSVICLVHPDYGVISFKRQPPTGHQLVILTTAMPAGTTTVESVPLTVSLPQAGDGTRHEQAVSASDFEVPTCMKRKGVGTALLAVMAGVASEQGAQFVVITNVVADEMIKLCTKLGLAAYKGSVHGDYRAEQGEVLRNAAQLLNEKGWQAQPPGALR